MSAKPSEVAGANAQAAAILAEALVGSAFSPSPARRVRHVVAAPGSRHTPILLALAAMPQVRLHMVLDERAAAFVALGIAKRTGEAAVLCCTSGSAGAHFLPAIVEASESCVPFIVVTADRPAELQSSGAPQTMPQSGLFAPHVRFEQTLPVPDQAALPSILGAYRVQGGRARAIAEALDKGPVHLNVPFREPLWAKPQRIGRPQRTPLRAPIEVRCAPCTVDAPTQAWLCHLATGAKRGLIVVGPLPPDAAGRADAVGILALAEHLGWPCLVDGCSQLRRAATGHADGALLVTSADALLRQPAFAEHLAAPDVVVRFGRLPTSKVLWTWLGRVGAEAATTNVLVDAQAQWHDPAHVGDTLVVASPGATCAAWLAALPVKEAHGAHAAADAWRAVWRQGQSLALKAMVQALEPDAPPVRAPPGASHVADASEAYVASALFAALPEEAILHVASSMPIRDLESFAQARPASPSASLGPTISCSRGVNGIDGTLATLLGLAHAGGEGPVVGLMGDLAFLHDVGSLQLWRQMPRPAVAIVVNNGGGDIFAHLPIASLAAEDLAHAEGRVTKPFDAYFRTPQKADMEALCRAAHIGFCQVTTNQAFAATLQTLGIAACGGRQQPAQGLVVVEVVVVPETSRQARTHIHEAVARALSAL